MAPRETGFGIVGAGFIGAYHSAAVRKIPGARLVGVSSRKIDSARKLADKHGVWAGPYEELIKRDDLDVVIVCTPSGTHADYTIQALEAGKHVLVEKPIDITLEKADAMILAADKAQRKLGVVFQSRFLPNAQKIKSVIDSGRLGKPVMNDMICKWWRDQKYYDEGEWKGTRALDGGGALMNQGIHGVDLLWWFGGDVKSVVAHTATRAHTGIEVEDVAVASLGFTSGAVGMLIASTACFPGQPTRHEIHGDRGGVVINQDGKILRWEFIDETDEDKQIKEAAKNPAPATVTSDPAAGLGDKHLPVSRDMMDAILQDREPMISGRQGRKSLEIVLAVYESAREGREVSLPL